MNVPNAKDFIASNGSGDHEIRLYITGDNACPVLRWRNPSGWSAPDSAFAYAAGHVLLQSAIREMRAWIERTSGKPLVQALREEGGPTRS